jgi:hypothetical protein
MKTILFFSLIALTLSLNSCSSGSDSDNNPNPDPDPVTITYSNTIKSIITTNCISCHGSTPSNGAAISLDTYAKVKTATQNNLIDRISLAQGNAQMMPKDGTRLPQATIDKFTTWKNNGYLE